jgi:hypothetical protein
MGGRIDLISLLSPNASSRIKLDDLGGSFLSLRSRWRRSQGPEYLESLQGLLSDSPPRLRGAAFTADVEGSQLAGVNPTQDRVRGDGISLA